MNLGYRPVGDMISEVQGIIQNRSLTKRQKIREALNQGYAHAVTAYDWKQIETHSELGLRKYDDTLTDLVANQGFFPLPWNCEIVKSIVLYEPSSCDLEEVDMAELARRRGSRLNNAGRPAVWAQVGRTAQYRELPASGTVTAKSSSAGNNSPVERVVRVRYQSSQGQVGQPFWEDLAGNFTTGVPLSLPVLAGWNIEAVELPAGWVGDFTLSDSVPNELVKLTSGEAPITTANNSYRHWSRILARAAPVPDLDYKGVITYDRIPTALLEDLDTPEIPVSPFLVDYAVSRMLREDGRADEAGPFERNAEISLRRAARASPETRTSAIPRGRNILWATGLQQRTKW